MSALQLHVTAAGIAAIINAENTGTAPVLISHVGLTDQVFSASGATTLPGELKRLTTFGGAAVANDTIHITIRDDSTDSYTLRGFGLYLGDGTLFAVYSHAGETPDYIMQKASAAMLLLQSDVRFTQINATNITFGSAEWLNPPATTTVAGVVELADTAEAIAGADPSRAVTPAGMKATLDGRLGEGAPSGFVKGLLALATAAAIRAAIGLGAAALRDEGHGKGLDADKLDGQEGSWYRDWANLTGKPAMFTPTAHAHQWSDILNPPASATRWPSWLEVTDRPATFPPSSHTHAAADITSGTFDTARIPALPVSQITNLQQLLDAKARINNPQFTGSATFQGVLNAMSGNIGISALAETSSTYWLRDEAGRLRGALQWDRATDTIRLIRHNDAGNDIATTLALPPNGNAEWNGRALWHAGNFDPNSKAPLSNPQFTGTGIKIGAGQAGECNVAFGVDDWYLYSNSGNFGMFSPSKGMGFAFDKAAKTLAVNNFNVWTSGNFNPATKANLTGAAFTGEISATGVSAGKIRLINAEGGRTGYMAWYADSGVRVGYLGYAAGTTLIWNLENGFNAVDLNAAFIARGGFDTGSSRKLKDIEGPMPYGLAEVRRIKTWIGHYKPEFNPDGRQRLFFDAEQFFEVMPQVVDPEGVEHNGEKVPTIKLDQVMPPAYRAIAELADMVDELRAEVAALKAGR